jgi:uncharacterized repeat protein (TIGR03803 family)
MTSTITSLSEGFEYGITRLIWFAMILCPTVGFATTASAQAQETVLYSFQGGGDGAGPVGSIVMDKAGNLYGATYHTNTCVPTTQCGSVYEVSPPSRPGDSWTETTLYVFQGVEAGDGGEPGGGLIQDASGNLYGTTAYGGAGPCILLGTLAGCGTVYELVRPTEPGGKWIEKILYSFQGNQDGQLPIGDLVFDKRGNLYGATEFGGGKGDTCDPDYQYCGTVFELTPPRTTGSGSWTENVLHSFEGVDAGDGANPNGGLAIDAKGVLYGTTTIGGGHCVKISDAGCGTLYSLSSSAPNRPWSETILYRFGANHRDAAGPNGDLVFDKSGNLYGTTVGGGRYFSWGTVFRFAPKPGGGFSEAVIYSFQGGDDGFEPMAGIRFDKQGNLYGTATQGGKTGGGTVYRILAASHSFQIVYAFKATPDGFYPDSPLIFDAAGKLYGTNLYGGTGQACENYGCGTVFMIGQ